jgi:FtsH-binding integral membrane protein
MAQQRDLDEEAARLGDLRLDEVPKARDLDEVSQQLAGYKWRIEPSEDPEEADHRRFLEKARTFFGMALVVFILALGTQMAFFSTDSMLNRAGSALLVAILSAGLGYVAGSASRSK